MSQQTISTNQAPEVSIEQIQGDLSIKGWEDSEIAVKADPSGLKFSEEDDAIHILCNGDCSVRLPYGSTVSIGTVRGDSAIKQLEDQLTIGTVHGSLALRNVAETQIESVHGDMAAKHVAGDLQVRRILGNISIRDIQGQCTLEEVKGNLELRDVEAELHANVKGNARVRLSSMGGQDYAIQAEGNIDCRIPEDASVRIVLTSKGNIRVRLPGEKREIKAGTLETVLGDGESLLTLSAEGNLELTAMEAGWGEDVDTPDFGREFSGFTEEFNQQIGQQVEAQLEAQMEAINRQLSEQMARFSSDFAERGISDEQIEQMMQRARETSERATARAQEKMRRAQEKLERKMEAARRRSEMKAQAAERRAQTRSRKSWDFSWGSPPQPPEPEPEPVNEEERLMILRMLEQKKITIEEAENLLAALEGKES